MNNPQSRIVFPLDVQTQEEARSWCAKLCGEVGIMKVGLEQFTAHGPAALQAPRDAGFDIFLDLKLHDIPETVRRAAYQAAGHRVKYLTVHASGGPAMLAAAVQGAREGLMRDNSELLTILAVTVLTSLSATDLDATYGGTHKVADVVATMAKMAWDQGVRGFVCSPLEVEVLRDLFKGAATLVVPGIRPAGGGGDDQKRTDTPESAVKSGATHLVVGRPIRDAADPVAAARGIAEAIRPHLSVY